MNKNINLYENIKLLKLNINNPRFKLISYSVNEAWKCFIKRSIYRKQIIDLTKHILKKGLLYKFLIAIKENENYLILDGNRRVFVIKFLILEDFRNKIKEFNENFFNILNTILEENPDGLHKVKKTIKEVTIDVRDSIEEAKEILETIHSNETKDGKNLNQWPTWEIRISQNEKVATFIFEHFRFWNFTIFLEKIKNKPYFRYTIARDMLKTPITRKWLKVEKTNNGYKSTDDKYTKRKFLQALIYSIENLDKNVNKFFSKKHANETFKNIEKQHPFSDEFIGSRLDKLEKHKKDLENYNTNSSLNKISNKNPINIANNTSIFFEKTCALIKNENSKLGKIINTISKLSESQIKKYWILVSFSIRPIIEILVNKYLKEILTNTNQKQSLRQKIEAILKNINLNNYNKKINTDSVKWFTKNDPKLDPLYILNNNFHSDINMLYCDLQTLLERTDAFGEVILKALENKN